MEFTTRAARNYPWQPSDEIRQLPYFVGLLVAWREVWFVALADRDCMPCLRSNGVLTRGPLAQKGYLRHRAQ
ncbi:hypothetical protein ASD63_26470 [Ensifer sp. Root558]|nr:hypothetical protein ASD63_26470 [Ensifer sp. Root558]